MLLAPRTSQLLAGRLVEQRQRQQGIRHACCCSLVGDTAVCELCLRVLVCRCIMLCADHGPCVSGAHNAIVTSRAGKDLVSCLVSGLLTIGPRFGGAIDDAARCAHQLGATA